MKAMIEFDHLYNEAFCLQTKEEIVSFFKEMKNAVCSDLKNKHVALLTLDKARPILEKVQVKTISSDTEEKEEGFIYKGEFHIEGVHTQNIYDRIYVEMEDVSFLKKVSSIDDYLSVMLKMRYSGFLMTEEDVMDYSNVAKKPFENNRAFSLCKVDGEKAVKLAVELASIVGKKPFEVCYRICGSVQRVFYVYDENHHFSFLSYLVDRTRTHDVEIRLMDNEIAHWFRLSKGLYDVPIRKKQIAG